MSIKFFDMFSGIGGFRSGLEALDGFECVGYCEIDKYAKKAYEAIYDTEGELYFEDARTIDPKDLPHILPRLKDLSICCLKTYPDCLTTTPAGRLQPSSVRWTNWGMMSRGKCLTAKITECRKPDAGCTLSDIIEKNVQEKYYLSHKQVGTLLYSSKEAVRESGFTPQTE